MTRKNIISVLSITGVIVAVLSALEPHLPFLASLCGYFGDGCRDAQAYLLLGVPIAYLGIIFYALVWAVWLIQPQLIFWVVMTGLGFEIQLAAIMVNQHFFCLFCMLNLLVMTGLTLAVMRRSLFWQSASIALAALVASHLLFSIDAVSPRAPASEAVADGSDEIAAYLAESPIYQKDLERQIAGKLYSLRYKIYKLKRVRLEAVVQERILALEAKEKGISPEALAAEIHGTASNVAEKDVIQYYMQNQQALSRSKEDPQELMAQIRNYLTKQRRVETMQAHILPLMEKYGFKDRFTPPEMPLSRVRVEHNFAAGPVDARVTIVEFSDYLCPACRKAHETTRRVREKYKGRIRWIFKDYPLKMHKGSKYLAMAARCAGEQGKFWEFQDLLFGSKSKELGRNDMIGFAKTL
ncbi:MAG: thioredoxin domain-containing protein, partial [Desulfobacterales bacterium]|nr:thioredoxin domain-containing protein [Desulfobacterales bacterium]